MEIQSMDLRKQVLQLRAVNFLHGLASSVMNFRVLYLSGIGLTATQSGIVMCLTMVMGTITPPLWGMLADSMRSKYRVFVLTVLGVSLTCALVPTLGPVRIGGLLLASAIIPLTNAFFIPSQSIVDASSVSASVTIPGVEYSRLRMWMSIGYTAGNLAMTPLVASWGSSIPFFASTGFALLLLFSGSVIKQYEEPPRERVDAEEAPMEKVRFSRLFQNYYLMVFLIINILICIPSNYSSFMVYLLEEINADTSLVGIVIACRVTGEVLTLLVSPWLKARFPTPMLMLASAGCFCLEMLGYQFADSVVTATLSCCFGGAAYGLVLCTAINYVNQLSPRGMQSTAVSVWLSGGQVAGMIAMLAGGAVIDALGVRSMFLIGLGCAVLWIVVFLGSYAFGEKVLKQKAPLPLFRRHSPSQDR